MRKEEGFFCGNIRYKKTGEEGILEHVRKMERGKHDLEWTEIEYVKIRSA